MNIDYGGFRLERSGKVNGYYWAVIGYFMGHRCGYVRVLPKHPANGKHYDSVNVDNVHGGLTYSANYPDSIWGMCNFPRGGTVFGFDCRHLYDADDPSLMPGYIKEKHVAEVLMNDASGKVIRTADYVERECLSLIEQLEKLAVTK